MRKPNKNLCMLSSGTRFTGTITTDDELIVEGQFIGNGKIGGHVTLSSGAQWIGNLDVKSATVYGSVNGNLRADKYVEVLGGGKVFGDVSCNQVRIDPGACISGELSMNQSRTVICLPNVAGAPLTSVSQIPNADFGAIKKLV